MGCDGWTVTGGLHRVRVVTVSCNGWAVTKCNGRLADLEGTAGVARGVGNFLRAELDGVRVDDVARGIGGPATDGSGGGGGGGGGGDGGCHVVGVTRAAGGSRGDGEGGGCEPLLDNGAQLAVRVRREVEGRRCRSEGGGSRGLTVTWPLHACYTRRGSGESSPPIVGLTNTRVKQPVTRRLHGGCLTLTWRLHGGYIAVTRR